MPYFIWACEIECSPEGSINSVLNTVLQFITRLQAHITMKICGGGGFRTCLVPIPWWDFLRLRATRAASFAASIGLSVLLMLLVLPLLCVSGDGIGRRQGRTEGVAVGATVSPDWERGAGRCWACSADRAPHYVGPTGRPLLHSGTPRATWANPSRHLAFN